MTLPPKPSIICPHIFEAIVFSQLCAYLQDKAFLLGFPPSGETIRLQVVADVNTSRRACDNL
ncbi:MAG: hypothetical protein Q4A84_00135 [Neisseria sp.]|uniref:hypothetical protein n=1 Tax=Neisseria sp. TaxID=192066 RepID=UPI0026DCDF99|nr:hypothetical protein [Neisseria sp.]MDO4640103.1 hypothetical protein [Neisseria sp.]